jgi:hypothetical protein
MLHFVQPAGPAGLAVDQRRLTGADEADRWDSPPTGRGGAQYVSHVGHFGARRMTDLIAAFL